MNIDLTILDKEPEALAKITEALARVYFDNVLKRGYNIEPIEKAYSIAFNLCPNYRLILKDRPEFAGKYGHLRHYDCDGFNMGHIFSLPIKELKPEVCDATDDDSSNGDDKQKADVNNS